MFYQGPSRDTASETDALVTRIRNGDPEAWREVSVAFRQRLRDLAASELPAQVSGRLDASDMVQQTFAEAGQSYDRFLGRSLPELFAWMAVILKHNVSDAVRQH